MVMLVAPQHTTLRVAGTIRLMARANVPLNFFGLLLGSLVGLLMVTVVESKLRRTQVVRRTNGTTACGIL